MKKYLITGAVFAGLFVPSSAMAWNGPEPVCVPGQGEVVMSEEDYYKNNPGDWIYPVPPEGCEVTPPPPPPPVTPPEVVVPPAPVTPEPTQPTPPEENVPEVTPPVEKKEVPKRSIGHPVKPVSSPEPVDNAPEVATLPRTGFSVWYLLPIGAILFGVGFALYQRNTVNN